MWALEFRELTEEDYADALVHGLLDKYSEYYTAEEYEKIMDIGILKERIDELKNKYGSSK